MGHHRINILLALLLGVTNCSLYGGTRKGDKLLNEGQRAEDQKDYDKAVELYDQALSVDPADPAYRLAVTRARSGAGRFHLQKGRDQRAGGHFDEALAEFQRAFALDPSTRLPLQEITQTKEMIRRAASEPAKSGEETLTLPRASAAGKRRAIKPARRSACTEGGQWIRRAAENQ